MSWTYKLHLNSKRSDKLSENTRSSPAQLSVLHSSYFIFFPGTPSPTRDKLTSNRSSNSVLCYWFYFNVYSVVFLFILHRSQQKVIMIPTHLAVPEVQYSSIAQEHLSSLKSKGKETTIASPSCKR